MLILRHLSNLIFTAIAILQSQQAIAAPVDDVIVIVSSEPAGTTTQEDFTPIILDIMEHDALAVHKKSIAAYISNNGMKPPEIPIQWSSSARYMYAGPYKLAVISIGMVAKPSEYSEDIIIRGIKGDEGFNIACTSRKSGRVPIYGPCANKVEEIFGYGFVPRK